MIYLNNKPFLWLKSFPLPQRGDIVHYIVESDEIELVETKKFKITNVEWKYIKHSFSSCEPQVHIDVYLTGIVVLPRCKHKHWIAADKDDSPSAKCADCGERNGQWFCPSPDSPNGLCDYTKHGDDQCTYCGDPDERK